MSDAEITRRATIIIFSELAFFFIGFILLGVYFSKLRNFLKYLENNHNEKWKKLNGPSLFINASPKIIINTLRFIFSSEYYNDHKLEKLKYNTKKYLIIGISYFIFIAIMSIIVPILFISGHLDRFFM